MVYFVTKAEFSYGLISFRNSWGSGMRNSISHFPYEKFIRKKSIPAGTYIFADFDLLTQPQKDAVNKIYSEMSKFPESFFLVNHPLLSCDRFRLLEVLYQAGINPFRIYRVSQISSQIRFPVFVRKEPGHSGKITGLIYNYTELVDTIERIRKEGYPPEGILVTEFLETKDVEGIYRKYSSFIVGSEIIPRHIFFSRNWMIKGADLSDRNKSAEEMEYLGHCPHLDELRKVFEMANIRYGRIDYSMYHNKPVIWEINPNPMIASSSGLKKKARKFIHDNFSANIIDAFRKIDMIAPGRNHLKTDALTDYESITAYFPYNKFYYLMRDSYFRFKSKTLFIFYSILNFIR